MCFGYCVAPDLQCLSECDTFAKYGMYGYYNDARWNVDKEYTCLAVGHILDECFEDEQGGNAKHRRGQAALGKDDNNHHGNRQLLEAQAPTADRSLAEKPCPANPAALNRFGKPLQEHMACDFPSGACSIENAQVFCSLTKYAFDGRTSLVEGQECKASVSAQLQTVGDAPMSAASANVFVALADSFQCNGCPTLDDPSTAAYICDDSTAPSKCRDPYLAFLAIWLPQQGMDLASFKTAFCDCGGFMTNGPQDLKAHLCGFEVPDPWPSECKDVFGQGDPNKNDQYWDAYCLPQCDWDDVTNPWCADVTCVEGYAHMHKSGNGEYDLDEAYKSGTCTRPNTFKDDMEPNLVACMKSVVGSGGQPDSHLSANQLSCDAVRQVSQYLVAYQTSSTSQPTWIPYFDQCNTYFGPVGTSQEARLRTVKFILEQWYIRQECFSWPDCDATGACDPTTYPGYAITECSTTTLSGVNLSKLPDCAALFKLESCVSQLFGSAIGSLEDLAFLHAAMDSSGCKPETCKLTSCSGCKSSSQCALVAPTVTTSKRTDCSWKKDGIGVGVFAGLIPSCVSTSCDRSLSSSCQNYPTKDLCNDVDCGPAGHCFWDVDGVVNPQQKNTCALFCSNPSFGSKNKCEANQGRCAWDATALKCNFNVNWVSA